MKNLFPGHYPPSISFDEALPDALVVFDTNVLLNFYEFGPATRKNSFETLLKIKERCWLPYHVALEFHRNRTGRVERALKAHTDAIKRVRAGIGEITLQIEKQDVLKNNEVTAELIDAFKASGEKLAQHAESATAELPQRSIEDPVNRFLADLFDERVGPAPTQALVDAINKEGQKRYEHNHPPGLTDAKSKQDEKFMDREIAYQGMYGDLYIWKQVLAHVAAVEGKKHLIFVTDERKPDWWAKDGDNILGPAPQLSQELALAARGWSLWMYRSPRFFDLLSTALGNRLSAEDLEEIREASVSIEWPAEVRRKFKPFMAAKHRSFRNEELNDSSSFDAFPFIELDGLTEHYFEWIGLQLPGWEYTIHKADSTDEEMLLVANSRSKDVDFTYAYHIIFLRDPNHPYISNPWSSQNSTLLRSSIEATSAITVLDTSRLDTNARDQVVHQVAQTSLMRVGKKNEPTVYVTTLRSDRIEVLFAR